MSTTINNTLPNDWNPSITYNKDDSVYYNNVIYKSLINSNLNNNPALNPDKWQAIDIYKKELTVMEHGDYSGDDSFWERDQFYIDVDGYVYMNGQNTGINVNGHTTVDIKWEDLTPAQREQLRGPQGLRGATGDTGEQGPQGPMGAVEWDNLTPAQIEQLRGIQGKSTYDIWLEQGYTGSENDFLCWLQSNIVTIDKELDNSSVHAVQNKVITKAINDYMVKTNNLLHQYDSRIQDLEDRLKAVYNNQEYTFRYGITSEGKHGYRINNSDTVIPFDNTSDVLSSMAAFTLGGIALNEFGQRAELVAPTIVNNRALQTNAASIKGSPSKNSDELNYSSFNSDENEVQVQTLDQFFFQAQNNFVYKDGYFLEDSSYDLTGMVYEEGVNLISAEVEDECEGIIILYETVKKKNLGYINFDITPNSSFSYCAGYSSAYPGYIPSLTSLRDDETKVRGTITERTIISFKVSNSYTVIFLCSGYGTRIPNFTINSIYFTSEKPEEVQ